jgi:hypothetical protein
LKYFFSNMLFACKTRKEEIAILRIAMNIYEEITICLFIIMML